MGKTTTSMTLDSEILNLAKERYPGQISNLVNNFLTDLLKTEITDKEKLEKELQENIKLNQKYTSQVNILNQQLKDIEEKEKEEKETQEQLIEENKKNEDIEKEIKESLDMREIEFFMRLNPKKGDEFNSSFYNNHFKKNYTIEQYRKRYLKFLKDVKKQ